MKAEVKILFSTFLLWGFIGLTVSTAQKPTARASTAAPTDKCLDQARVDPNAQCERVFEPVCGCDGKTYTNVCDASRSGVQSTQAGACPGSLQETVIKAVKAWEKAYNAADAVHLESTFATDATMVSSDGAVDGSKTIGRFYIRTFDEQEGKISIGISDIVPLVDNYVIISGTYKIDAVKKATREPVSDAGTFVNVSKVTDGQLSIIYHEVHTAAPDEKAPAVKAPVRN